MNNITAKEIKQFLKTNGFKTQKISVKDGDVIIKDLSISCKKVSELLKNEFGISSVGYDIDVFEKLVNSKFDEAELLLEEIKVTKTIRREFGEYVMTATAGSNGYCGTYAIRNESDFYYCGQFSNVYGIAYGLAIIEAN